MPVARLTACPSQKRPGPSSPSSSPFRRWTGSRDRSRPTRHVQDVPDDLAHWLRHRGHGVTCLRGVVLTTATDSETWQRPAGLPPAGSMSTSPATSAAYSAWNRTNRPPREAPTITNGAFAGLDLERHERQIANGENHRHRRRGNVLLLYPPKQIKAVHHPFEAGDSIRKVEGDVSTKRASTIRRRERRLPHGCSSDCSLFRDRHAQRVAGSIVAPAARISSSARAESPGLTSTPAMASSSTVTSNPARRPSSTECFTQ